MSVQLLLSGMLPPGLVQCSSQHSCAIAVTLSRVHVVHPYSSIDTTTSWKNCALFYLIWSNFHMTDSLSMALHPLASHVLMSFSTCYYRLNTEESC